MEIGKRRPVTGDLMIELSQKAAKEINRLKVDEEVTDDSCLRIRVETGGCSGFNYKLDFEPSEDGDRDKVFESHGAKIIVDSKSLLYLIGMTLDYEGGLNGKGFIFSNPNAKDKCSCGTSFSV